MWRLGYLLMFMFSPFILVFLFVKEFWDAGRRFEVILAIAVIVVLYSMMKPPFF